MPNHYINEEIVIKILICGATGFIGRNMAMKFSNRNDVELHLTRYKRPEFNVKGAQWHQVDLRDSVSVDRLVDGMDIVIQAAATTSGAKDIVARPYIHVTDNAVMNSYLLRSVFEHKVKHFIFFSCTVMYESSDNGLKELDFDANTPLHPRYFGVGNTKIYIEKMCEFYSKICDTKFTAIRHSNIYGRFDKFDLERSHVFGATITKVLKAESVVSVWGTGEEERDLLHADDLADFVNSVIEKQSEGYRLYNCGTGKAISIIDLVKKIVKLSGRDLRIEHDLTQPTIKTSLFLDCGLAEEELGWRPKIALDDGIAATIDWWRNNVDPISLINKN